MKKHAKGTPFFFDENVFDDDAPPKISEEDLPPPLEFTAQDMEGAKAKAFEEGKAAGYKESEAGLTQKILMLLQKVDQTAALLFTAEDERQALYEVEAVDLTVTALRQILPMLIQKFGIEEVKAVLRDALQAAEKKDQITIEVPSDLIAPLQEYINTLDSNKLTSVKFEENPALTEGDCKMFWSDGGVLYDTEAISKKILSILDETLAVSGRKSHDTGE